MSAFQVSKGEEGTRLDRFLQARTGLSRKRVKAFLDGGRIFIDGRRVVIASWEVKGGARIEVREDSGTPHPEAERYFLKVFYEDKDLLVVEKDPGIPCERSPLATTPTLPEVINIYLKRKYPHLKGHYLGLVHRLDKETSGLMVYTKTKEANRITDQFKRHTIKRKYLAVVEGAMEGEEGTIEGYLQKSSLLKGGRKVKSSTPASGQRAVTHWRLIERYPEVSLIEVTLNTGRTHQIRVQMVEIGHPVVGDKIYGRGGSAAAAGRTASATPFPRQALHASFLGFHHPITGKKMEFKSDLPRDMRGLVNRLRIGS